MYAAPGKTLMKFQYGQALLKTLFHRLCQRKTEVVTDRTKDFDIQGS